MNFGLQAAGCRGSRMAYSATGCASLQPRMRADHQYDQLGANPACAHWGCGACALEQLDGPLDEVRRPSTAGRATGGNDSRRTQPSPAETCC